MYAKNNKKLAVINAKIDDLQKLKSQLEENYANDLSTQIAQILVKKKAFNVDKSALLKTIESAIDAIQNSDSKVYL